MRIPYRPMDIDSSSVGDPSAFRTLSELERALGAAETAPRDTGRVVAIVRRGENGRREILERVRLTREEGLPGDAWGRRPTRSTATQLTVMQAGVARLIAAGQPLPLFGDNLLVDLDLSTGTLSAGSRVRMGAAVLEVTPKPHNGCKKFVSRFGEEALRFVSKPELRHLNLRGIHMRVIEDGDVAAGDAIEVLSRPVPLLVREARPGDADAWLAMRLALWPEESADDLRSEVGRFAAEGPRRGEAVLIAEDPAGARLGFAELSIRSYAEGCTTDRVAYLEAWFVVPDARRSGVGRALVEAAEAWGRAQGCTEFGSDAVEENRVSAAAHRALGFTEVVTVRCFRKDL
jgi:aminoglycoside 6'-N-acetyltransferase I